MGSVKTRPKAPAPQVIYYQPVPVSTPPADTGGESETPEDVQKQREKNLLRRARSSIGTVLNGFRGILSPAETQGQRKTLLGE